MGGNPSGYWPQIDLKPSCQFPSPNTTTTTMLSDTQPLDFNGYYFQSTSFHTPQTTGFYPSSCQYDASTPAAYSNQSRFN